MNAREAAKIAKEKSESKKFLVPQEILERITFFANEGDFETSVYGSELSPHAREELKKMGYTITVFSWSNEVEVVTIGWALK